MITKIYRKAFAVVLKKPLILWGIVMLNALLTGVVTALFGAVPGIALGINLALSTSMTLIFLKGYRGEEVHCVDLFGCLKDFQTAKRVILGMLWMTLWIFIWGLIPIVGPIFAIIKSYSYRLTPYILTLEPEVKITDAIHVSENRTTGYRAQMFGADFLVYVIYFVVVLVLGWFAGITADVEIISHFFSFIIAIISIVFVALVPLFVGLVQSAFYEEIMAKHNTGAPSEEPANNDAQ